MFLCRLTSYLLICLLAFVVCEMKFEIFLIKFEPFTDWYARNILEMVQLVIAQA